MFRPLPRKASYSVAPLYFGNGDLHRVERIAGVKESRSDKIITFCRSFSVGTLRHLEPGTHDRCHAFVQHNFVELDDKRYVEQAAERIHRFLGMLDRLLTEGEELPTLVLPSAPKLKSLSNRAKWSAEEEKRRRARIAAIERKRAQLQRERDMLAAMEKALREEKERIAAKRAEIEARLAHVKPILDAALAGLEAVKDEHLWEVRSYLTPPPMVHKVMSSVLTVLGTENADKWDVIKSQIQRKDFIPTVRAFDANSVTLETVRRLKRFTADPQYTHENAVKASKAAAPLRTWVVALTQYAEVFAEVRPLLEELERIAAQDLAARERAITAQREVIRKLEREIEDMERALRDIFDEDELRARDADAQKAIDDYNRRVTMSWESKCDELRAKYEAAVTRILNKPPQISDEAKRVADVTRRRCLEVLELIDRTFESFVSPVAHAELHIERSRSPKHSASRARAGAAVSAGRATTPRQLRFNSPTASSVRRAASAERGRPGGRAASPIGARPAVGGTASSAVAGSSPATPRVSQSPHRSPISFSTTRSRTPTRSPLGRPAAGTAWRGTAVERYYALASATSPAPQKPGTQTYTLV